MQELMLDSTKVDDANFLPHLRGLSRLVVLDLSYTGVSNAGMRRYVSGIPPRSSSRCHRGSDRSLNHLTPKSAAIGFTFRPVHGNRSRLLDLDPVGEGACKEIASTHFRKPRFRQ